MRPNSSLPSNPSTSAEEVFYAAIEMPVSRREQFIDEQCHENAALKLEVERLVTGFNENEKGDFILDQLPASVANQEPQTTLAGIAAEGVGDTIGRYRLLEKIGEGGMGVVYMAEQIEGVRRRVALKIIKLGMDTRQVIARFEAERQAMAMFDHPNIARVFDVGSTHQGRPFFVMELVKGVGLIDYVKENAMPLNERLSLFVSVCHAVQHAHQKGIIHRDLKPSNILVTLYDGVPVSKVIDFGIAKAIGHQLTDKTLFTRFSAMMGTPQYMSPEQAEMNGLDVDTRSDIYSLGVLLYELVTGTTPLSKAQLKQLNPLALFETLRDADFESPSTRIAKTLETKKSNAASKSVVVNVDPIKGDLDWVVMKALARDRKIRFASANEFGSDVQRYLDGEPVLAAPPSRIYRMKSYLRKHLAATVMAAAIGATLLTATIVCSVFAINAQQANSELEVANNELFVANASLSENVTKLRAAESELQNVAEAKQYSFAETLAIARFSGDFDQVIYETAERMYPKVFGATEMLYVMSGSGDDTDNEFDEENPSTGPDDIAAPVVINVCLDFDEQALWDLKYKDFLSHSISRLSTLQKKNDDFQARMEEQMHSGMEEHLERLIGSNQLDDEGEISFQGSREFHRHEHSDECIALRKELEKVLVNYRPKFYRYLVTEYRRSFGESDRRVAGGLNLLAASLIEAGNLNEAEAHLREAARLGVVREQKAAALLKNEIAKIRNASNSLSIPKRDGRSD